MCNIIYGKSLIIYCFKGMLHVFCNSKLDKTSVSKHWKKRCKILKVINFTDFVEIRFSRRLCVSAEHKFHLSCLETLTFSLHNLC